MQCLALMITETMMSLIFTLSQTGTEVATLQIQPNVLKTRFYTKTSITTSVSHRLHHASISMPSSPSVLHSELNNRVPLRDNCGQNVSDGIVNCPANATIATIEKPKQAKFHSHPILAGTAYVEAMAEGRCPDPLGQPQGNLKNNRIRNKTFDSFKTKAWSGKLKKQISMLRGKKQDEKPDNHSQNFEVEALPVDCYFAALQGPELDSLRIDVDIGSSTVVNGVLGLVCGVITTLVVDKAFLVQVIKQQRCRRTTGHWTALLNQRRPLYSKQRELFR